MIAGLRRWAANVPDLGDVVKRFPMPTLAMAVFTLILILRDALSNDEQIARTLVGLVIGAYLCVAHVLASETSGKRANIILQFLFLGVFTAIGYFSEALRFNLFMGVGAVVLILGNMVIWRQSRDDLHVWDFTHKLWAGAVFATVGSMIFTFGVFAISAALKSLFDVKIDSLIEYILLPIGLGLLAPLYWMATLPPVDEDYNELYESPDFVSKAVTFLGTWLLSPLALIYALILLAYGVKIVLAGELPNGQTAGLTSPFLIIGTLTWLVLDPPFARENTLAKLFRKLWWPVSIPAALLLSVAVFVRIREYGYTPERFALTLLVVWALGLAVWFSVGPKARRDIRLIPGFAAVLLTLGAVGAGWLSFANQAQRFEAGLMASGIVSAQGEISEITDQTAAKRAKGALNYLMRYNGEEKVKAIIDKTGLTLNLKEFDNNSVQEALGLEKVTISDRWSNRDNIEYRRVEDPISIVGFEQLYGPFSYYTEVKESILIKVEGSLTAGVSSGIMTLTFEGEEVVFDMNKWIKTQNFSTGNVILDDPSIALFNTVDREIKLVFNNFNAWTETGDEGDDVDRFNVNFYLLTRGID